MARMFLNPPHGFPEYPSKPGTECTVCGKNGRTLSMHQMSVRRTWVCEPCITRYHLTFCDVCDRVEPLHYMLEKSGHRHCTECLHPTWRFPEHAERILATR